MYAPALAGAGRGCWVSAAVPLWCELSGAGRCWWICRHTRTCDKPSGHHQTLTTLIPPIVTNQLPPTNCHQTLVINRLSSTNCHQPIVTNKLSPTNCHQPIVNNNCPPTNCHQPFVFSRGSGPVLAGAGRCWWVFALLEGLFLRACVFKKHGPQPIVTNQLSHQPIATHQLSPTTYADILSC